MSSDELDVLPGGIREAAARLDVAPRGLYEAAKRGDLPFVCRINSRYVVPRRAFERFLETAGREDARTSNKNS